MHARLAGELAQRLIPFGGFQRHLKLALTAILTTFFRHLFLHELVIVLSHSITLARGLVSGVNYSNKHLRHRYLRTDMFDIRDGAVALRQNNRLRLSFKSQQLERSIYALYSYYFQTCALQTVR